MSAAGVMNEPKPEALVQDMLYPSTPFSIFGMPGVGKSLLALLLACCVVARRPFLSRAVNMPGPRSVIYVAAEGGAFLGARLRAIQDAYRFTATDLANLFILRRAVALTDAFTAEEFIITVKALLRDRPAPALIVFDTLTKCLGRAGANENEPKDTALLADRIDAIIEATGAAVGFVTHTGWQGRHERGHSNLRGNVETAMLVTRTADPAVIKLSCEKSNNGAGFGSVNVRVETRGDAAVVVQPTVSLRTFADPGASKPLLPNDAKALRALAHEPGEIAFGRWANVAQLSQASLDRARQRLHKAKLVASHGPESRPRWALTDAGRARAAELEAAEA